MNADEQADTEDRPAGELTPEEAREKRARYLALYQSYAEDDHKARTDDNDATEPTMTTFVLPGD